MKIVIQVWGRWYATKISKQIQLNLRRRVFEHAVRLPLHRVQEIRSGGVASILREDGGSVGELVFGMLFNPWQAIIQLIGSLAILAWVDWTLLLGAIAALADCFFDASHLDQQHPAAIPRDSQAARTDRRRGDRILCRNADRAGVQPAKNARRARFTTENNLMARQELYAWWWMRTDRDGVGGVDSDRQCRLAVLRRSGGFSRGT